MKTRQALEAVSNLVDRLERKLKRLIQANQVVVKGLRGLGVRLQAWEATYGLPSKRKRR